MSWDEFKKHYGWLAIGSGVIVILLLGLPFLFMYLTYSHYHTMSLPEAIVYISPVVGAVAIVITGLVTLGRRNPEE